MEADRFCQATAKGTHNRCKRAAIAGGTVCHMRGAAASQVKQKAALRVAQQQAEIMVDRLGGRTDVSPEQAVLDLVMEAAANVEVYRRLLVEIGLPADADESAHPLIPLYNAERDRLFTFASTAAKIGISELVVRISERQGKKLVEILEAVIVDPTLGLDAVQRDVFRGVTAKHMRAVR